MKETKKKSKKPLENKGCATCGLSFTPKRADSKYCSRLCYRRNPTVARSYSDRTNNYQKRHSKELTRRFNKLKYKCRHEGIDLKIDFKVYERLIPLGCIYCGKTLEQETGCSLDRINSDIGYLESNIVPCCGSCNQIKNVHLNFHEMKVAMKAILEYRNVKEHSNS